MKVPKTDYSLLIFLLFLFGVALSYLLWVACTLSVNPFDTYEIYMDARAIAGGIADVYHYKRPPLLPLLFSPFFLVGSDAQAIIFSRIVAVSMYGGLLFGCYRLYRLHLSRLYSLTGVFLMGLNRALIHHAPFTREDIPSAFFTVWFFYFYVRSQAKHQFRLKAAMVVFFAAAVSSRFNILFVLVPFIFIYEIFHLVTILGTKKESIRKWIVPFVARVTFMPLIGVGLTFMMVIFIYERVGLAAPVNAVAAFLRHRQIHYGFIAEYKVGFWDSFMENLSTIQISMTAPLLALFFVGIAIAFAKKTKGAVLHGLWGSIFFLVQTFVIRHNEIRYLFPLFVSIYFFLAVGVLELKHWVMHTPLLLIRRGVVKRIISITLLIAVFFLPIKTAAAEYLRFQDPFYRNQYVNDVCFKAEQAAGTNGDIFWVGPMYPLHPKKYQFHPQDSYSYIYHFYNHVCEFLLGRKLEIIDKPILKEGNGGLIYVQFFGYEADEGDVLVLNQEKAHYSSASMPEQLKPIKIERVKEFEFLYVGTDAKGILTYLSADLPGASIRIVPLKGRFSFTLTNVPFKLYDIYFNIIPQHPLFSEGFIEVSEGTQTFWSGHPFSEMIGSINLLFYEKVQDFDHPNLMNSPNKQK